MKALHLISALVLSAATAGHAQISFSGKEGLPGNGKKVVLLAGDEEYRSEEAMPMLAKLLSNNHGFDTTVLFSVNPDTGEIDPGNHTNIPGMEALDSADLVIMLWRFRRPEDASMKHFSDYFLAGKPIIALRTSTHAFNYPPVKNADGTETPNPSPYAKFGWNNKEGWVGGFGKEVLGETWVTHWGVHKKEAAKGVIEPSAKDNPILRGVKDIFGDADVYEAYPPADSTILVRGEVLTGMTEDTPPATHSKARATDKVEQPVNDPMMPVIWTREYKNEAGKTNKILTSTMGSATDLQSPDLRRLLVNASYSFTGLEVPELADVGTTGTFTPTFYGFGTHIKGMKPEDYAKLPLSEPAATPDAPAKEPSDAKR